MPIDVALLGCAHPHVTDVLGVLSSEPHLRLVAAWDADRSAVPVVIDGAAVSQAETAIRRAGVVVICAPTFQRPALSVQAARAGRPVLVEKPLATTAAQAAAVARDIARTRTPARGAFFLRELPALQRLRAVLDAGLLGRVAQVDATFAHPGAADGWFRGPTEWMLDPERAGVGAFGDLALHLVDALAVLAGGETPLVGAVVLDRPGPARGDLGGVAAGSWSGVPLSLRTSWSSRPGGLELTVAGAQGTAVLRGGVLELARDGHRTERWVGAPPDAGAALRAFADDLLAGRPARRDLTPVVRAQQALEAAVVIA